MTIKFEWHRAMTRSDLKDGVKLTAFALWDFADADGRNARPGNKALAEARGVTQRSISTHLAELVSGGWCRKVRDGRTVGPRKSAAEYELTAPEGIDLAKSGLPMVGTDHMKRELPMVAADHAKSGLPMVAPRGADHGKPELLPNRSVTTTAAAVGRTEKPEPLPDDWVPTARHVRDAIKRNLDVDAVALKFRNWAVQNNVLLRDWNIRFSAWIADEKPRHLAAARSGNAGGRLWQE